MQQLNNVRVAVRLPLGIGLGLLTMLGIGVLSLSTLGDLRVGGPAFDTVTEHNEFVVEIAPPVASIAPVDRELNTIALQLIATGTASEVALGRLESAVATYEERTESWLEHFEPGTDEHETLSAAYEAAREYVAVIDMLIAAARNGGDVNAVVQEYEPQLRATRNAYDEAIDDAVSVAREHADEVLGDVIDDADRRQLLMWAVLITVLLSATIVSVPITMSVVRPLRALRDRLQAISRGDAPGERLDAARKDEFGEVALAFNDLSARLADEAVRSAADATSARERAREIEHAASSAAANMNQIASASADLAHAASDIATNAGAASRTAESAVAAAERADELMGRLAATSVRIADSVDAIQGIAAQTTMLSLNAAVEAARAGEMGAGFAVVAGEVKSLASETGAATHEISERVDEIKVDTDAALVALAEVTDVIGEINTSLTTIAVAVDHHATATVAIDRSLGEAVGAVSGLTASTSSETNGDLSFTTAA